MKTGTRPLINWCECADHECPHHKGSDCEAPATEHLHRIDMEDITGVLFCEACYEDALESGVFG